ncbi:MULTISPECIES: amidohydrolase family protein [unclassified Bradyrhizobium]|uniref:amidohydrolase family protein n=1 Tax=unclassified Bradyrhizobium TaxID=2631580 RepID=UPI00247A625E|nr:MULTISPECIES: amidohydrolase family protein [unclassified Bradyrhizobium]WGS20378.1 amidohydrolase family protein [Bradyrhizobium sp. ISRA463]WGS27256.1 amidohydrolase family protein [Bradyrhizobium sp. ISRA464]
MGGLVISGGRVVDPASGMDAVGDVAVLDGRIAAVGTGLGSAERQIDASGLVVAPGFIDLHAHGQTIPADRMQAFDGVTTTLDLEAGVLPVASWYRRQAEKGRVLNYGAAANWAFARIGAMTGSNEESSLESFGRAMRDRRWIENVASETEVAGILDRLGNGLNEGGIGIGILNAYAPGAGVQELTAVCQLAATHGVPTFTHVAYMSRIDPESAAEAYIRLIGYAGATGAHMHICHFNSSSKTDVERCSALIAKAQAQGLPITVEAYPYGTGSTVLAATFFSDPQFEERNGLGYDSVQRVTDGHRFGSREELLTAQAEEPSTLVLWHVLDIENNPYHRNLLDISVLYPGGAIASDAMPWTLSNGKVYTGDAWPLPDDATSHPRSAGCFTRFIREWVRERRAVSLLEGIRKCALIPAEILAASTPAMRAKGRLQVGADADIVVFDYESLSDRATFTAMNRPAEGVRHLVVSGQPLISDGVLDVTARPGRPVRRPVTAES